MENILKLLMLLATIYLITTCYKCNQEKFSDMVLNNKNPSELSMYVNDVPYSFVSLNQIKPEYKKNIMESLEKNTQFIDHRENIINVKKGKFIKTPVFIIKTVDASKLIEGKPLEFNLVANGVPNFALVPVENSRRINDKHLYYDEKLDMLYYTRVGISSSKSIINVVNNSFEKKFNVIPDPEFPNFYILNLSKTNDSNLNLKIN